MNSSAYESMRGYDESRSTSININRRSAKFDTVDFTVGSMPTNFGYDESFGEKEEDLNDTQLKPRILIMGLRRSGKTSIKNVVFHKMEPQNTGHLESTTITNIEDITCCSFITFQVYDCAGQIDLFSDPTCDSNALLKGCSSLIFVIDAQVSLEIESLII
jgi:hypothetical protein